MVKSNKRVAVIINRIRSPHRKHNHFGRNLAVKKEALGHQKEPYVIVMQEIALVVPYPNKLL